VCSASNPPFFAWRRDLARVKYFISIVDVIDIDENSRDKPYSMNQHVISVRVQAN